MLSIRPITLSISAIFGRKLTGWRRNKRNERGFSAVEYALILALIAAVCIVSLRLIGTNISDVFATLHAHL